MQVKKTRPSNNSLVTVLPRGFINTNLVLFVGAGASIAWPTNLPSFYSLRDYLIDALFCRFSCPTDVNNLEIDTKPELLLQIIWEYLNDDVNPISGFKNALPNENHYNIANTCNSGVKLIITTNFDQCIEIALNDFQIDFTVYYKSPSNQEEVEELISLIVKSKKVVIWKPHGDCEHIETLCYTIHHVAKLSVSKYLKIIYEYILSKYDILTLGYSGYDDDLFPILLNYPQFNPSTKKLYWNSFTEIQPNSPPYFIKKEWGEKFHVFKGDMKDLFASSDLATKHKNFITQADGNITWENGIELELKKIKPDWAICILGQYYYRLNKYNEARYLWQKGLNQVNISESNKIRFELNLLIDNNLNKLKEIFAKAIELKEYNIAKIALAKAIDNLLHKKEFRKAKILLKVLRNLYESNPQFVTFSDYASNVINYLVLNYNRVIKRINDYEHKLLLLVFENSKERGDIIGAIKALDSYIGSLAVNDFQNEQMFKQLIDYVPVLEAYNIPNDLASLYFTISIYSSRIMQKETGLKYLDKCLEKTKACYHSHVYSEDRYRKLTAYILHQKSMFGTAEQAIVLIKEAIEQIELIKDFSQLENSKDYFLGIYYSSLSNNYQIIGKMNKALKYIVLAIEHSRKVNDIREEARSLMYYGELLFGKGKRSEAVEILKESLMKHEYVGENKIKVQAMIKKLDLENEIRKPAPNRVDWPASKE
ncbi:MAG: SIR2 family protein [Sphingobacteriia bacterium]|nr:SIR2 family protein [Sphingobacteriia bacterium]